MTTTEPAPTVTGMKRKRPSGLGAIPSVTVDGTDRSQISALQDQYNVFRAVHLPKIVVRNNEAKVNDGAVEEKDTAAKEAYTERTGVSIDDLDHQKHQEHESNFTWKNVDGLFRSLQQDRESWCVENSAANKDDNRSKPGSFLVTDQNDNDNDNDNDTTKGTQAGYCSFLLQRDKTILDETLERLPVSEIPGNDKQWHHGPCVWFFFGRNPAGDTILQGRPEHTDSVSHDGTWHYQLSGTKRWHLRPTDELQRLVEREHGIRLDTARAFVVDCHQGDVLIVNTRLWWHRTQIPVQPHPSVSYARDFYFRKDQELSERVGVDPESQSTEPVAGSTTDKATGASHMTNVDGVYASKDIPEGEIIFTEKEMPDGEMHRSKQPNCVVAELEDGTNAVMARRPIASGEFLSVADSSDEESEGECDDDDEAEDEEIEFVEETDDDEDGR